MGEFYISMDAETLGGNPYMNPMINLGCVAFSPNGTEMGRFTVNLSWPEGYEADPSTLEWFKTENAEAWSVITKDPKRPLEAMKMLREWCTFMCAKGGNRPVWVFYPSIFDGSWLYCYWFKYLGHPAGGKGPGFSAIDIRTYAMGKLGCSYEETRKDKPLMKPFVPNTEDAPHTHTGLDDAYEQGLLFLNLKNNKTPNL
jgi:3' exoribonuclease, RNase T-like